MWFHHVLVNYANEVRVMRGKFYIATSNKWDFLFVSIFSNDFSKTKQKKKKKMNSRALMKMMSSRDLLQWIPTKNICITNTISRRECVRIVLLLWWLQKKYVKSRLTSCNKHFEDENGKLGYSAFFFSLSPQRNCARCLGQLSIVVVFLVVHILSSVVRTMDKSAV